MKHLYCLLAALFLALTAHAQYSLESYHTKLEDSLRSDGITEIYFVGTGDLQFGLTDRTAANKGIPANTGLGVLFWRIWRGGRELQLDAKINIASTVDTVFAQTTATGVITNNRLFGRYALVPAGSGQATQLNALLYFPRPAMRFGEYDSLTYPKKLGRFVSGMDINAAASNQVWTAMTPAVAGAAPTMRSVNVSTLAWRLGFFHDFMPQELGRQKGYAIRFGLNVISRSLQGDIGLHTDPMEAMRRDFLGASNTTFWGGELLLALRLKNIRAEASLPYIFRRNNETIPGMTGGQFITSISFVGGFPLSIGNASNSTAAAKAKK